MDHTQDYYAILGVSPEASAEDIKAAYRKAARRFHPDANSNPGAALQFKDITAAHEVIGNVSNRLSYDNMRQRLAAESPYFYVELIPSKRTLTAIPEPQVVYSLIEIRPNKEYNPDNRPNTPLNLVLVLDRSKSMQEGARLERVKLAAHQIIDQLSETDYLSLVTFSDRADPLILSENLTDKGALKSLVNTMTANGGTEIYQGLSMAMKAVKPQLSKDRVNHIILLTDGETYDDKQLSLDLADDAVQQGIGISAMGIGTEWNDIFLDEIAAKTGGHSAYINSPGAVVRFLNERVRSLGSTFAERVMLTIAPDPDITLESVFKLVPNPQPLEDLKQPIQLGALEYRRSIRLLVQLQAKGGLQTGFRGLMRVDITGDVLHKKRHNYKVISDLSVEVAAEPVQEEPPRKILDALGKLTLHRMQQRAEESIKSGNFEEATRRLENLATRLLAAGQDELAKTAQAEARRVQQTRGLSEEGRKAIKFGTRALLLPTPEEEEDEEKASEVKKEAAQNVAPADNATKIVSPLPSGDKPIGSSEQHSQAAAPNPEQAHSNPQSPTEKPSKKEDEA